MRCFYQLLGAVGLSLCLSLPVGAAVMWTTASDGQALATIDSNTGAGTIIGPSNAVNAYAAAFAPNGTLYTITNYTSSTGRRLATFNTSTGQATPVSSNQLGAISQFLPLEITPAGTFYGGDWNGVFYTIIPATGVATAVGNMGFADVMDFALDNTGTLWATGQNQLWTVNPATGVGTFKATITGGPVYVMGIMFDSANQMFATDYNSSNSPLYKINTTTGVATGVGNTGFFQPHGGDFPIPEPASAGLLATAGAMVVLRRRRQQK
jgi:hypothetical protein